MQLQMKLQLDLWPCRCPPLLAKATLRFHVVRSVCAADGETVLLGDTLAFQGLCFPSA